MDSVRTNMAWTRPLLRIPQLAWLLMCLQGITMVTSQGALCSSPMAPAQIIILKDVLEDWPVGTTLVNLVIHGSDDEISLQLDKTNEYLTFDPVSRNLTLVKRFNYTKSPSLSLDLLCENKITPQEKPLVIPILVVLQDVNDNPPVFKQSEYVATVNEMIPVNTTVVSGIKAEDADIQNWYILYSIVEEEYTTYFDFPTPAIGDLVLRRPLDYETMGTFTFHVRATDNHPPVLNEVHPLNSTAVVTIHLTDGDDQNPAFSSPSYYATVEEIATVDSAVTVSPAIEAFDLDVGIGSPVVFSFLPDLNGDSEFFNVNPETAAVTVANNAFQRGRVFTLLVKASQTDNPDRYATSLLRVGIQAANEGPPRFLQPLYSASLVENTPVGTPVTTVSAIDNDEGSVLAYRFAETVEDFTIDSRRGVITTAKSLDFEQIPFYNLTVQVSDGKYTAETVVAVQIIDINDHKPVFSQNVYTFESRREKHVIVGTVRAVDADRGSVVQYTFVENSDHFNIEPNGEIKITNADLTASEYKLFVVATDNGDPEQQDSAVVVVKFDPLTAPVADDDDGQTHLVIIIILAVLAGVLLIIIIIMLIYIYRKVVAHSLGGATLLSFFSHGFLPRQSFERATGLKPDYRAYLETQEGANFKPTARHLQLYDDIRLDEDATTTQENPFRGMESSTDPHASSGPGYTYVYSEPRDLNNVRQGSTESTSQGGGYYRSTSSMAKPSKGFPPTSSSNFNSDYSVNKQMGEMNEMEYETAVAPLDDIPVTAIGDGGGGNYLGSSTSSLQSVPNGNFSTFKMSDSTQQLVMPRVSTIRKGGSVTFEDEPGLSLYGSQNPASSNSSSTRVNNSTDKITVYY